MLRLCCRPREKTYGSSRDPAKVVRLKGMRNRGDFLAAVAVTVVARFRESR